METFSTILQSPNGVAFELNKSLSCVSTEVEIWTYNNEVIKVAWLRDTNFDIQFLGNIILKTYRNF